MFFIMGMNQGQKVLDFHQTIVCNVCGRYGRYEVFMTYMVLSLFFIPLFKWNKHYYVKTSCCETVYELDPEVGKAIASGMEVTIEESDLILVSRGSHYSQESGKRVCGSCGYEADADFEYCPKCGRRL